MTYCGGFPNFSIEKPISIPWKSDQLLSMEESGEYVAELKLNEHRGFITTDENGVPTFFSYRGPEPKDVPALEGVSLPPCSVFDGGHLFRKDFGSRLWIFDVLILEGKKVRRPFEERKALRDHHVSPSSTVWLPFSTSSFVREFQDMLNGRSKLIHQASEAYDFPDLAPFIEGFVIKRKDARPCFPRSKRETASSFKLRIADVIGNPNWVKVVK